MYFVVVTNCNYLIIQFQGLTTVLESFSERTTYSESFAVASAENATMECVVLGCYFDDFFYEEHPIAPASCIIGGTNEPSSPSASLSPSATRSPSPLLSSSASPSPVQPSDCKCDCNGNVAIEYKIEQTPSSGNNDVVRGSTLTKRDIKGIAQKKEDKGKKHSDQIMTLVA